MIGIVRTYSGSLRLGLVCTYCAVLCLMAGAPLARAAGKGSGQRPGAQAQPDQSAASLYAIGSAARAAGRLVAASQALTAAYRLQPSADGLRELGLLALAGNHRLLAHDLLQRYLRQSAADPDASEARAAVQNLLDAPLPPHGRLRVVGEPGSFIWLDEHLVGSLPLAAALLVSPDEHKLRVEQRSGSIESSIHVPNLRMAEVRLGPGDSKTLVVELLTAVLLVPDVETQGSHAPRSELTELLGHLKGAMENAHLTLLTASAALEFTGAARLADCLSQDACQAQLARLCAVDYALRLHITRPEESLHSPVELQLMDATVGEVAATATHSCAGCEAPQQASQLTAAISALIARASARPRGQLEVLSSPLDAEVLVNGRLRGHTPYRGTHWVGAHSLVVQRPGWVMEERRLQVLESQTTSVHLTLREQPASTEPAADARRHAAPSVTAGSETAGRARRSRPIWRPIAGAAALGGGALLLGFGAGALAVTGSCAVPLSENDEICPRLYDTTRLGAGLTASGGVLALGGVLLLALPSRH